MRNMTLFIFSTSLTTAFQELLKTWQSGSLTINKMAGLLCKKSSRQGVSVKTDPDNPRTEGQQPGPGAAQPQTNQLPTRPGWAGNGSPQTTLCSTPSGSPHALLAEFQFPNQMHCHNYALLPFMHPAGWTQKLLVIKCLLCEQGWGSFHT